MNIEDTKLVASVDRTQHQGRHICLDGRWYEGEGEGCLVTDVTCHYLVASILRKQGVR